MSCKNMNNTLYNATHCVDVLYKNNVNLSRNVLFVIEENPNFLLIKVRDVNEFAFNYSVNVDNLEFEKMKQEQCLDINYDEFHDQIVDLLKQTLSKDMLLRLEADDIKCKLIFYEKSRIKSLIFLTIDLSVTSEREIIDEMTQNILQLKELNKKLSQQLALSNKQIQDKDMLLKTALTNNKELTSTFCKDISSTELLLTRNLANLEKNISNKLHELNIRHLKLICNLECIKRDNNIRIELNAHLNGSVQDLRREKENQTKTLKELYIENQNLNCMKQNAEKNCNDLKQLLSNRDREIESLRDEIDALKKDVHEASIIIAQKTKTHDEIAKDLIQANTMLVNFNNHYEIMSKEADQLKEIVNNKEKVIKEQIKKITSVSEEFEKYRDQYNSQRIKMLECDLLEANQKIEKLEKHNNEMNKLNCILTKRLAPVYNSSN